MHVKFAASMSKVYKALLPCGPPCCEMNYVYVHVYLIVNSSPKFIEIIILGCTIEMKILGSEEHHRSAK